MIAYMLSALLTVFGWGVLVLMLVLQRVFGGARLAADENPAIQPESA